MHADLSAQLNGLAQKRLAEVQRTQSYDDLKMSVINTEVMLGQMEHQCNADSEDYDELLGLLDGIWGDICSAAVKKAGSLADDSTSFSDDLNLNPDEMRTALHDNYLYGALSAVFAANEDKSVKKLPLLTAAAFNKHSYAGYKDEIACLRMLLWAGFDPNATDSGGRTALHFMTSMKNLPGSHPRAVRLLLQAGIDPNLKNKNGDTALCYMAGSTSWLDAHTETAWKLLHNGADPFIEAGDGACAYSLWKKNQGGSDDIADIVQAIERVMEKRPEAEGDGNGNGGYSQMVGEKIKSFLVANDAKGLYEFLGYLMAIIVAKQLGEDEQFAEKIAPIMLDGLDGEDFIEKLGPSLEEGDSDEIGRVAHEYLFDAAEAQFEKLKASMEA